MPTNGMTINGLNPLSALTADDKIPVWDTGASGEPTKEITAQNMANSVKSLASLPNTTEMNTAIEQSTADVIRTGDVVNDLTNTDPTKVLAAPQGKTLNDRFGGWYIAKSLRGGAGYNDITINNIPNNVGTGFIIGTKGLYTFHTTGTLVSDSSGLTIENRGNNVYRFTFDSEWYRPAMLITSWDRS